MRAIFLKQMLIWSCGAVVLCARMSVMNATVSLLSHITTAYNFDSDVMINRLILDVLVIQDGRDVRHL